VSYSDNILTLDALKNKIDEQIIYGVKTTDCEDFLPE